MGYLSSAECGSVRKMNCFHSSQICKSVWRNNRDRPAFSLNQLMFFSNCFVLCSDFIFFMQNFLEGVLSSRCMHLWLLVNRKNSFDIIYSPVASNQCDPFFFLKFNLLVLFKEDSLCSVWLKWCQSPLMLSFNMFLQYFQWRRTFFVIYSSRIFSYTITEFIHFLLSLYFQFSF